MLPSDLKQVIGQLLAPPASGAAPDLRIVSAGGGSINQTYRVEAGGHTHFLKVNDRERFPGMFARERDGLACLGAQGIIRIPQVTACLETSRHQLLVLEWVDSGIPDRPYWDHFGSQLARLHQISHDQFGFWQNNYIGALPQDNRPATAWPEFFFSRRLHPMAEQAVRAGRAPGSLLRAVEGLYTRLATVLPDCRPALLHGDLWQGNYLCSRSGEPVLIDPAVYFGHRYMDLAMTSLFGGFDRRFYEAYHYHYPLEPGYEEAWEVCNLYPLLVHLTLFGRRYLRPVEEVLKKYLS
ncbi:MAG TPA: fructosamine kinase family protein [Chitinophagaceae bacterium]|nr:fructosamine kinase family protein [Chitinophagaceae bacterium]